MANQVYDSLKSGLLSATIDLLNDPICVLLVQESNATITTSAIALSSTISLEYSGSSGTDITQTSGVNYNKNGYELTNKVVSAGSEAGTIMFDADDITISGGPPENTSITAGAMLLYVSASPIEQSIPLAYFDFGVDQVTVNNPFVIQWHSTGILTLETKVT